MFTPVCDFFFKDEYELTLFLLALFLLFVFGTQASGHWLAR
jgi:hypothetical protein